LNKQGHEVLGIDLTDPDTGDIITELIEFGDGTFKEKYQNFQPEYIFHLACKPRVAYSVIDPVGTMQNNVMATSVLLNYARKIGTKRLIYSDSSSVVGDGNGPNSPYGLQKYISELECQLYSKLYGLDTVCLRYFNVYSPCQTADDVYATAICNWMKFIREGNNPYITGTGDQRRDMIHVEDVISVNIFCMERAVNLNGSVHDIGTGGNISLNEVRDIVLKYFPNVTFDYIKERVGDVMHTQANTTSLQKLGWEAKHSIESGMHECYSRLLEEIYTRKERVGAK
jgi:UDP-glucose 4-epimerase